MIIGRKCNKKYYNNHKTTPCAIIFMRVAVAHYGFTFYSYLFPFLHHLCLANICTLCNNTIAFSYLSFVSTTLGLNHLFLFILLLLKLPPTLS